MAFFFSIFTATRDSRLFPRPPSGLVPNDGCVVQVSRGVYRAASFLTLGGSLVLALRLGGLTNWNPGLARVGVHYCLTGFVS